MEPTNKPVQVSEVPAWPRFVRSCCREATYMRGTNFSQLPDWFVGVAQKDPFVGIGAARLGRSSPPRRYRYRRIIRSNRLGVCHASRARKWRREPLISYPCGAATHRRTLEPALILGGQGAIRGRAGGGAGREGMIMIRRGILTITVAALPLLALTAIATAAAPNPWDTCYGACAARCAAQHSCQHRRASRNCFAHYNECKNLCRMSCPR